MKNLLVYFSTLFFLISCRSELSDAQKLEYAQKGKQIAQATAEKMLAEVVKNMTEGGVAQAIPYCNAHAPEITNEFSKSFDVNIKRTSHLLRNEKNTPNNRENEIIQTYLKQKKEDYQPIVEKNKDGSVQFYAPIVLQQKCTVCHGELGITMEQATDSIVKKLYPNDKAIGFKEGDLRGIWSIQFTKK